jgi:hypothetical protein
MFKKLVANIKKAVNRRDGVSFNPALFEDEMALQTKWSPLVPGGSNFKTRKLSIVPGAYRANFKSSFGAILFAMLFLLIGVGVLLIGIRFFINKGAVLDSFFLTGFGAVFAAVGTFMLYFFTKPIVFDKNSGFFWKGRLSPEKLNFSYDNIKNCTPLERIYAFQIISEYCHSDKSSYYSYELNLVLKDGSRLNVVDHGNAAAIRKDAELLGEFLGIPVWDAT